MYKIHVADDRDHDRLERTGSETLDNSSDEQEMIVICATTDHSANNTHHPGKQEYRSFSIFARQSTDEWTSSTNNEKLVSSELSDLRNGHSELN